jgi:hypothetical protein
MTAVMTLAVAAAMTLQHLQKEHPKKNLSNTYSNNHQKDLSRSFFFGYLLRTRCEAKAIQNKKKAKKIENKP